MRAPALVGIITALHIFAITAFIFIQGCGTTRPTLHSAQEVDEAPAPVMPPNTAPPRTQVRSIPSTPQPTTAPMVSPAEAMDSYTIQKGDTLSHVAKKFGISFRELAEFNGLANPNNVRIGQTIKIPSSGTSGAATPIAPVIKPVMTPVATATGDAYVVLAGDSLSRIASIHGIKIADLKQANGLTSDRILVGQKLVIPGPGVVVTPAPTETMDAPPVEEEIGVLSITGSDPTGIVIPDIEVPDEVETSQTPVIPPTSMTPQNKPIPYTVVAGDTLDEIAKLFIVSKQDIMELNGLGADDPLTPGQKILIPPSEL